MEAVCVRSHEDSWAASWALLASAGHLARIVDTVVLEHPQLDVLVAVFVLLGLGVGLFLALLSTTIKAAQHLKAAALLNSKGGQHAVLGQLLAAEHNTSVLSAESCTVELGSVLNLQVVEHHGTL